MTDEFEVKLNENEVKVLKEEEWKIMVEKKMRDYELSLLKAIRYYKLGVPSCLSPCWGQFQGTLASYAIQVGNFTSLQDSVYTPDFL